MSATYTLHVAPYGRPGDPDALDRADLVRDGFSWGAFLVPALWLFRHRHWFLGLAVLAVVFGLAALLRVAGLGSGTIVVAELLLHLLIGFEAATLRRWSYARRGRPAVDVVFATSEADAEAKSFARWLLPPPIGPRVVAPFRATPTLRRGLEPVIGLFPDLEGRS